MDIQVKRNSYSTILVVEDTNVKIETDVSSPIYARKEDGSKDFTKRLGEDINDDSLTMMTSVLDDMIYYRDKEFDSSDLIFNQSHLGAGNLVAFAIHRLADSCGERKAANGLRKD